MAGSGARGMVGVAFGVTPQDADFAALRDEFLNQYAHRQPHRMQPFEGVVELLHALQQSGQRWDSVTNKHARFTPPLLGACPTPAGASGVVCRDSTRTPAPAGSSTPGRQRTG